jgi:hypothetical protein
MASGSIRILEEDEAIQRIVETVQQADPASAPFALVLGSGFSYGLVPTVRQIIEVSLPSWIESLSGKATYAELLESKAMHVNIAKEFWRRFVQRNQSRNLDFSLDSETGLPDDYPAAYRSAFDPAFSGALGGPGPARKFQQAIMRLDQPRLNAAHFLLASILGVQPGKSPQNNLFKARAAFSRLILTTNFDPFLQVALQLVNRLYFMSDTPELGISDEILDEQPDTIHLVYVHGSIHRRFQAANDAEIQRLKDTNARVLASVMKRRGVIVLGYSGWDDAIVDALVTCGGFDQMLYWCGREPDPLAKGAFGPRVPDILRKSTANYVQVSNAGHFMAQLSAQFVRGLPRALDNPIAQLREMLQKIDLTELEVVQPSVQPKLGGVRSSSTTDALAMAQRNVLIRLETAEQFFANPAASSDFLMRAEPKPLDTARAAAALANHQESISLYTQFLKVGDPNIGDVAQALLERGVEHYLAGSVENAVADWSSLADLPGAPVEQIAQALLNRGVAWGQKGDTDKEIADYSRVIEQLPGAPVEQVAWALVNRGVAWGK